MQVYRYDPSKNCWVRCGPDLDEATPIIGSYPNHDSSSKSGHVLYVTALHRTKLGNGKVIFLLEGKFQL